jgi:hypothetical protein
MKPKIKKPNFIKRNPKKIIFYNLDSSSMEKEEKSRQNLEELVNAGCIIVGSCGQIGSFCRIILQKG